MNEERVAKGVPTVDLIVDGGVRRGRDIVKAMALGAKAVMIGRPLIYGLGLGGTPGVEKVRSVSWRFSDGFSVVLALMLPRVLVAGAAVVRSVS